MFIIMFKDLRLVRLFRYDIIGKSRLTIELMAARQKDAERIDDCYQRLMNFCLHGKRPW